MAYDPLEKGSLVKFAGLALGILIGGLFGPLAFTPLGLGVPLGATAGSLFGAILGFLAAAGSLLLERRRRDEELRRACKAVLKEAKLPESIVIKVKDAHVTLQGEVEDHGVRHLAEQAISTVPGIKSVINQIRLKPSGSVSVTPAELRRQIRDHLVKRAEQESQGIAVIVDNSRVILEGTVASWVDASAAEVAAWDVPGVAEVENRLKIAA